jgi:hypothetical protein
MATLAPSAASRRAIAAPMPRDAPVTRATFPASFPVLLLLMDGFFHGFGLILNLSSFRSSAGKQTVDLVLFQTEDLEPDQSNISPTSIFQLE